jgi:hypothetical protein
MRLALIGLRGVGSLEHGFRRCDGWNLKDNKGLDVPCSASVPGVTAFGCGMTDQFEDHHQAVPGVTPSRVSLT